MEKVCKCLNIRTLCHNLYASLNFLERFQHVFKDLEYSINGKKCDCIIQSVNIKHITMRGLFDQYFVSFNIQQDGVTRLQNFNKIDMLYSKMHQIDLKGTQAKMTDHS